MTVDLHSAVRTAVDARRAEATEYLRANAGRSHPLVRRLIRYEREARGMCDWADDVLRRHVAEYPGNPDEDCAHCVEPMPCPDLISVAAAFGVETGQTA